MEFCEKCGGVIIVKEDRASCVTCGFKLKKKPKIEASEKINQHGTVAVINEEASTTHPIIQIPCTKCKNKEAYFWTTQTRASDESETKFYRCVKCKHTWRDYK